MTQENKKKIEKKAKSLLVNKDIPPDRMDIVRSLLNNESLTREEKYSAVIDIIKTCPDKGTQKKKENTRQKGKVPELLKPVQGNESFIPLEPLEPLTDINEILLKYRSTKLFRKRYLIHVNNRIGVGFRKRLIPGKKLLKAIRYIVSLQSKILARLPDILTAILKDETIDDPLLFNYLRIFRRWMMETPVIKYNMYELKWMSPEHFEIELKSYIINFFSFFRMDGEIKEQILLLVENKLRVMDDLTKDETNKHDSSSLTADQEKKNLKKEKLIYDYIMILRCFLQAGFNKSDMLSDYLKLNFGINSLPDFLLILSEALAFQRKINLGEIISTYNIKPHSVSSENWDYDEVFLKEIGKDPESRRKKVVQKLKDELMPYDELYSLLKLKIDGQIVLQNAIETQWKYADKKQKDYSYIYNDDFLTFVDVCINYFNNTFASLLNGSVITFQDKNEACIDGSIFGPSYFAHELSSISGLLNELHRFKTENPRMAVSREETIKILQGKIRSMFEVDRFVSLTGELFYQIGEKIQEVYDSHRLWILNGSKLKDRQALYRPLTKAAENDGGSPIPFYNSRIIAFKDNRLLSDKLTGKNVLTDNTRGGIIINLNAFSYQLAYECMSDKIYTRLEQRKDLLKRIKDIGDY